MNYPLFDRCWIVNSLATKIGIVTIRIGGKDICSFWFAHNLKNLKLDRIAEKMDELKDFLNSKVKLEIIKVAWLQVSTKSSNDTF